jgi:hypothetical protein
MTETRIKTRPDGSIDTNFYMARGRHMRSEAAHDMAAGLRSAIGATARDDAGHRPFRRGILGLGPRRAR